MATVAGWPNVAAPRPSPLRMMGIPVESTGMVVVGEAVAGATVAAAGGVGEGVEGLTAPAGWLLGASDNPSPIPRPVPSIKTARRMKGVRRRPPTTRCYAHGLQFRSAAAYVLATGSDEAVRIFPMAFRAEKSRLRHALRPGETILASDLLGLWLQRPNLDRPPVLVVTDMAIYLILSGRDREVSRIDFDALVGVGRRGRYGRQFQLMLDSGEVLTFQYHPRDRHGRTADLITERFFGHIVKNTEDDSTASGERMAD